MTGQDWVQVIKTAFEHGWAPGLFAIFLIVFFFKLPAIIRAIGSARKDVIEAKGKVANMERRLEIDLKQLEGKRRKPRRESQKPTRGARNPRNEDK